MRFWLSDNKLITSQSPPRRYARREARRIAGLSLHCNLDALTFDNLEVERGLASIGYVKVRRSEPCRFHTRHAHRIGGD